MYPFCLASYTLIRFSSTLSHVFLMPSFYRALHPSKVHAYVVPSWWSDVRHVCPHSSADKHQTQEGPEFITIVIQIWPWIRNTTVYSRTVVHCVELASQLVPALVGSCGTETSPCSEHTSSCCFMSAWLCAHMCSLKVCVCIKHWGNKI